MHKHYLVANFQFSVLLPVYHGNTPDEFTVALNSILSQTLPATEIVIVRDGPVVEGISLQLETLINTPNVKVVELPKNMGLGTALNEGLKHCSYEWVARMDADDKSQPDRFEVTVNYIVANPELDLVGSYYAEQHPKGKDFVRKVPLDFDGVLAFSGYRNPHSHPTVFYKKSAVQEAGGYVNFYFAEDWYLWLRMFKSGSQSGNIPKVLVYAQSQNYSRRLGLTSVRNDFKAIGGFCKEGLITHQQYLLGIFVRALVKLLPDGWAGKFYKNYLRSATNH